MGITFPQGHAEAKPIRSRAAPMAHARRQPRDQGTHGEGQEKMSSTIEACHGNSSTFLTETEESANTEIVMGPRQRSHALPMLTPEPSASASCVSQRPAASLAGRIPLLGTFGAPYSKRAHRKGMTAHSDSCARYARGMVLQLYNIIIIKI